jgi:hypothetical protein
MWNARTFAAYAKRTKDFLMFNFNSPGNGVFITIGMIVIKTLPVGGD